MLEHYSECSKIMKCLLTWLLITSLHPTMDWVPGCNHTLTEQIDFYLWTLLLRQNILESKCLPVPLQDTLYMLTIKSFHKMSSQQSFCTFFQETFQEKGAKWMEFTSVSTVDDGIMKLQLPSIIMMWESTMCWDFRFYWNVDQ